MTSTADNQRVLPLAENDAPPSETNGAYKPGPWWKIHLFRGMINDLRRRVPFYGSDWLDAWDYRVVPATVYMYFAK